MTRMTRPDCAVMCNLINTHTHIYIYVWRIDDDDGSIVGIVNCFSVGTVLFVV